MSIDEARRFIAKVRWRFASTMRFAPHWYVLKRECSEAGYEDEFNAFFELINAEGYDRRWHSRSFRSLNIDDHYYWAMGSHGGNPPLHEIICINRAKIEADQARQLSLEDEQ